MSEPLRDPVPPGHGEHRSQGGARPGSDLACWCGRPLRPFRTRHTRPDGSTFEGEARWTCDEHGHARFVVLLVRPDGVPREIGRSTELRRALEEAEDARELWAKSEAFVGVVDEDDGERGWLDEDDL